MVRSFGFGQQGMPGPPDGMPRRASFGGTAALAAVLLLGACSGAEEPSRRAIAGEVPRYAAPSDGIRVASLAGSYLAGKFAQRSRDYDAAADYLTSALKADSKNQRLRRNTYLALLASGRMSQAAELAGAIVARNPTSPLANLSVVVEDVRAGRFEEAEKRLRVLPRRGVNTYLAPMILAWTLAAQGRTEDALDALEPLADKSDLAALHDLHAGLINHLAGNAKAAEEALLRAATPSPALRVVQALGALYERTGRGAEATALYAKYMEENADSRAFEDAADRIAKGKLAAPIVTTPLEGVAEAFFNMAGTVTQGRSVELGLVYGRFALYLRPDFPVGQLLVAGILETLERDQEAIALYDAVDRNSPFSWNARLRKAAALDNGRRPDDAITLLQEMARESGGRNDVLITLADLLRGNKRYSESIEVYSRAIAQIPKLGKEHWSLLYARGIALERSQLWPQAESDFRQALELSPDQPYVLNYLGYTWVDQGIHLDEAQDMIRKAVKLRPNDGYIVDSLGWVLYRLGDFRGATEQLERAVVLRPEDPTINDHLGDAYWKVGRLKEATFQWRRALALDPEPEMIPAIQRKIRVGVTGDPKPGGDG